MLDLKNNPHENRTFISMMPFNAKKRAKVSDNWKVNDYKWIDVHVIINNEWMDRCECKRLTVPKVTQFPPSIIFFLITPGNFHLSIQNIYFDVKLYARMKMKGLLFDGNDIKSVMLVVLKWCNFTYYRHKS